MKRGLWLAAMAAVGAAAAGAWAADAGPPETKAPNAVQHEMRELALAMQVTLNAIANNTLGDVTPAIHKVHGARDLTEAALKDKLVVLPKNGDKLAAFIKEDEAFHNELVKLVKAARANDLTAATRQFGVVMNGCTACHSKYRF